MKPVWENFFPEGGKTHSEETKIQMSEAKKGKNNPLFGKTGKNHPMFGKGKPLSEETKAKMSEAKKGQNHPFFGKTRSEETKAKISAAHGAGPSLHPYYASSRMEGGSIEVLGPPFFF